MATCNSSFSRHREPLPTPYDWGPKFTSANADVISFQIFGTFLEFHNYVCNAFGLFDEGTYTHIFEKLDLFGNYGRPFELVDKDFKWFHPSPSDVASQDNFRQYVFDGSIYWDYYGDKDTVDYIDSLFSSVKYERTAAFADRQLLFSNILFRKLLKLFFIRDILDYATGVVGNPYINRWKIRLWIGMNIDYATGYVADIRGVLGQRPFQVLPWPVGGRVIKRFHVYFSPPNNILDQGIKEINFWIGGKRFPIQNFYYTLSYVERVGLLDLAESVSEAKGIPFDRSLVPTSFFKILYE